MPASDDPGLYPPRPLRPLQIGDVRIEYSDSEGEGETLLLIHAGGFADWFTPLAAEPVLAGMRVIRMVRAGYTSSPPPSTPLSIAEHAAHCAALLESLQVPGAHVLAHSSGTIIALQLALDFPDLVRTLTLSEPPLLDVLAAPQDLDLLHEAIGAQLGAAIAAASRGDLPGAFDTFMSAVCGPDHAQVIADALGPEGLHRAEQGCRYFFTGEIPAAEQWHFDQFAAARIHQSVLLVQGGISPPPVHRLIARLAAMLPNAETATIERENHLLPLRSPAALAHLAADHSYLHPSPTRA